jgi:hypothetical protein
VDVVEVLADVVDDRGILGCEGGLADVLDGLALVLAAGAGNLVSVARFDR